MLQSKLYVFKVFALFLLVAGGDELFSQNQNNNWVFGRKTGINKTSTGINIIKNSKLNSLEACGSVSDFNTGDLLFYTDGLSVWDSTNTVMPNGDSLKGGESCAQGALILPHYKLADKYLIFSAPEFRNKDNKMYYSVVDMGLRGGLGDIEAQNKNIVVVDSVCEGLTYSFNKDSSGYWLITRERNSDRFISILIDSSGVGSKVVYSKFPGGRTNNFSVLTLSPNGKKLSVTNTSQEYIEFYSFDNCTGKLSNKFTIGGIDRANYGAAFSPNSNIFYFTTSFEFNGQRSELLQMDLSSNDSATIRNSITLIGRPTFRFNSIVYFGNLQLHADNKIYVAEISNKELSVIENPDVLGIGCSYSKNKISLQGGASTYGLPQPVPGRLKPPKFITNVGNITLSDSCIEDSVKFTLNGINNIDKFSWSLIDANSVVVQQGQTINPTLKITAKDSYTFDVVASVGCDKYLVSIAFTMGNCTCEGEITVSDTCKDENIEFSITSDDAINTVSWEYFDDNGNLLFTSNDLKPSRRFTQQQGVTIKAIVDFDCGVDSLEKTITIEDCNCTISIPNVFTPNNDDLNDDFGVVTNCTLSNFSCEIFNRWGERLYKTSSPTDKWDGTYRKEKAPSGVYFFIISYLTQNGEARNKSGSLTLLR